MRRQIKYAQPDWRIVLGSLLRAIGDRPKRNFETDESRNLPETGRDISRRGTESNRIGCWQKACPVRATENRQGSAADKSDQRPKSIPNQSLMTQEPPTAPVKLRAMTSIVSTAVQKIDDAWPYRRRRVNGTRQRRSLWGQVVASG